MNILKGHIGIISSIALSPDSRNIISGSNGPSGMICITNMEGNIIKKYNRNPLSSINCIIYNKDGKKFICGNTNGIIYTHNSENNELLKH